MERLAGRQVKVPTRYRMRHLVHTTLSGKVMIDADLSAIDSSQIGQWFVCKPLVADTQLTDHFGE